ncbi:hypothetical protein M404DRAFT_997180 [Pisolithus tinctorius Marx 270]|uniref:Uncharacterized protein n=1 Tax=Pisolithus tinctorius Marx 270 TaxID=870435 RepID=A0A0C3JGR1_PISTI|nr:hypothetical protein M404DRAFT_997180 [Pisolithus tinctorius Marx 270]
MGEIPIPPHDNIDDIATIVDSLSSWTGKSEGTAPPSLVSSRSARFRASIVRTRRGGSTCPGF